MHCGLFQALLALIFLFAGGMKLILPIEALTEQIPCRVCSCGPVAEVLSVIMLGATVLTLPHR